MLAVCSRSVVKFNQRKLVRRICVAKLNPWHSDSRSVISKRFFTSSMAFTTKDYTAPEKKGMSINGNKSASKPPIFPKPSASVILVSPTNQVLLLQRVKTSSSFPSAHVFPGGNVSAAHDGFVPGPDQPGRHEDGPAYRLAAIRETFEESGILLARGSNGGILAVGEKEREEARKQIHRGDVKFLEWLESKGGKPDTDGLIPFTRWITPPKAPKRFTTQMYLYFLPLPGLSSNGTISTGISSDEDTVIPIPTHDGGVEHTAARFLPPSKWLSLARQNRIIMFPPQFYLLHLVSPYLSPDAAQTAIKPSSSEVFEQQRKLLLAFIKDPKVVPSWADRCISPIINATPGKSQRVILNLDKPGAELAGTNRSGDPDRVVVTVFKKEGPRDVDVRWRKEVMEEERELEKERKGKL